MNKILDAFILKEINIFIMNSKYNFLKNKSGRKKYEKFFFEKMIISKNNHLLKHIDLIRALDYNTRICLYDCYNNTMNCMKIKLLYHITFLMGKRRVFVDLFRSVLLSCRYKKINMFFLNMNIINDADNNVISLLKQQVQYGKNEIFEYLIMNISKLNIMSDKSINILKQYVILTIEIIDFVINEIPMVQFNYLDIKVEHENGNLKLSKNFKKFSDFLYNCLNKQKYYYRDYILFYNYVLLNHIIKQSNSIDYDFDSVYCRCSDIELYKIKTPELLFCNNNEMNGDSSKYYKLIECKKLNKELKILKNNIEQWKNKHQNPEYLFNYYNTDNSHQYLKFIKIIVNCSEYFLFLTSLYRQKNIEIEHVLNIFSYLSNNISTNAFYFYLIKI